MEDKDSIIDFDGELELVDENGRSASSPADFSVADNEQPYLGPERRGKFRRTAIDRRAHMRFGKKKKERRDGADRRKGAWNIQNTI